MLLRGDDPVGLMLQHGNIDCEKDDKRQRKKNLIKFFL